jgi:two-component system, OmpR family, aerobic respiration control sensor histidine kinase ArcB
MSTKKLEQDDRLIMSLSEDFRIKDISQSALSFFNLNHKDDILSHDFFYVLKQNKITTQLTMTLLKAALRKPLQLFDTVTVSSNTNQTMLWALSSIKPSRDILISGIELTNYHGLENIEKKTHDHLQNIINNAPCFIFWKDSDSIFLGCNKPFSDAAGLSEPADIIGKTDHDLPWSSQADLYCEDDQKVMMNNVGIINTEEPQTTKDGELIIIQTSKVPLRNEQGKAIGTLGIYTDITEIKKTQEQLQIAMEHAKTASTVKSEFIANMSHDIRTPITGILGLSQLLKNQLNSIKNKQYVSLIMTATNELLELLNDIIETVQIDANLIYRKHKLFSLSDIINHNTKLIQPAITHKSLELKVNIDHSAPDNLIGDKKHLDKILLNLLSNAIKFTEKGSITLNISTKPHPEKPNQIQLEIKVSDTGMGFSKQEQKKIFDHFTRLTPSYQGIYKGSGLGLYLVKKYVDDLAGSIDVESQEGKGSAFTITIPFSLPDEKRIESASEAKTEISASEVFNNILIVEDNHIAATTLEYQLKDMKCKHIVTASTATEALEKLQKNTVDLIILDIGLPDFSGTELTERIRQLEDTEKSQTRIIALTGHSNPALNEQCMALGIEKMLTKPILYDQLKVLVTRPED